MSSFQNYFRALSFNKIVVTVALGLGIGALVTLGYFYSVYQQIVVRPHVPEMISAAFNTSTPTPTPDPLASYSVLLLGYGGRDHDGGYLTDTMILARIDPKKSDITLISIPRDIWINLPLGREGNPGHKINTAYAFGLDNYQFPHKPLEFTGEAGGGQLAKYAVSQVLGFPVDYFIALSFDGFKESIDVLRGVDVDVPHTFDDHLYPIPEEKENDCGKSPEDNEAIAATLSGILLEKEFSCRYEQIHFDKGTEHMDGDRALKFVRSRKSDNFGGDYNRSLRQMALLQAVKDKIISIGFIPKIIPFTASLTSDMQTDIDASTITGKLKSHPDPSGFTIRTISLSDENVLKESRSEDGQYILVPATGSGWESVHEYIRHELGN